MSKITSIFWHILSRFKYHLVIIAGLAIVGFIDDESVLKRIEYEYQIEDLQKEIKELQALIDYLEGLLWTRSG